MQRRIGHARARTGGRCRRRRRSHTSLFCTAITDDPAMTRLDKAGHSSIILQDSFVHMAIFVAFHLRESQDGILTLGAVVVGLLPVVGTSPYRTKLRGSVFLKTRCHDGVELLVLATMSHHFVGVCAVVVTFQTMKVAA